MFLESSLCHYQRQSLVELVESYDEPIATACGATTTLGATAKAGSVIAIHLAKCCRNSNQLPTQSMGLRSPVREGSDASQPTASFPRSVTRRPLPQTILVLQRNQPTDCFDSSRGYRRAHGAVKKPS